MTKRNLEDYIMLVKESAENILRDIADGKSQKDSKMQEQIAYFMKLTKSFKRAYPYNRENYVARSTVYFALGWYYRAFMVIQSGLDEYEDDQCLRDLYQKIESVRHNKKKRISPETRDERSFRNLVESGALDPHVKIVVDKVAVEGRIVYLSATDIGIEITKPFSGISDGWHIPWFEAAYPQRLFYVGSITVKGIETAQSTLADIYRACELFSGNTAEIKAKYEEIKIITPRRWERRDLLLRFLRDHYGESRIGSSMLEQLIEKYL